MASFVYVLCALTSLGCFVLLVRQYRHSPGRLLLQSAIAFLCFAAANALLVVDRIVLPTVDLRLWRSVFALAGVVALLAGLITGREERQP